MSLTPFFEPESVAVIGATDRLQSVGATLLRNLLQGPPDRKIYPVNPKRSTLLGLDCYPDIGAVPGKVDLAVLVTPAETISAIVGACVAAEVKTAVVISAGFKEQGSAGAALEKQIQEQLRRGAMRLIGPNCLGVMCPPAGLNATFSQDAARPGNVAFLSQSGALQTAILDWSLREQVGFSGFVSTGSMLDVSWGDLIYHFGDDPATRSILMYMESIGDARSFLSAAREVALSKPIIVIKAGRTAAAAKAAASHTGALAGSDEVLDAAFRRCGVLRVSSIGDLFYMAETLGKQPRPRGPRLTILTNAGGPGVLATDALISNGGELARLSEQTTTALNEFLPPYWSHQNPIDILGDAGPDRYARALEIAAADPDSDGLLVILAPQGMTSPGEVAERLKPYANASGKPLLASWMGGVTVAQGEAILNAAGIPTFAYPDTAARVFDYMWRYTYNLRGIYETPILAEGPEAEAGRRAQVDEIIRQARERKQALLTEVVSKRVLAFYGIPVVETRVARDSNEAVRLAAKTGFPVVLKLHSETITHKTDAGGVKLNLKDEEAVRRAYTEIEKAVAAKDFQGVAVEPMIEHKGYELILGSSVDPQFGPVILFGSGGELVEVYRDRALALPPLNTTLAHRMMEQTRVFTALKGVRGRASVDIAALEALLVRFSELVIDHPWIKEIDVNPLLVSAERMVALDARVVLHPPGTAESELPRPAIRPYPTQYVSEWTMKDGTSVTLRPIRPEDEPLMVEFQESLSERSVYLRYFYMMNLSARVAHERMIRMCFLDYDRAMALVADHKDPRTGKHGILAVGRLNKRHGKNEAEVAVLVRDQYQRHGLGTELMGRLICVGREEKLERLGGETLLENPGMNALFRKLGFRRIPSADPRVVEAVLDL